jgi:hypothetical protein
MGELDFIGPIAGTGLVGIFFLMVVLRIKIMPTYVYDEAKADWERERSKLEASLDSAEAALREGQAVLVQQVTPALTRALDAERELLELRRQEQFQAQFRRDHPGGGAQ